MAVTVAYGWSVIDALGGYPFEGNVDAVGSADGLFVVGDRDGQTFGIRREADGDFAAEFNDKEGLDAAVTRLSDGNYAVVSSVGDRVRYRIYSPEGTPVTAELALEIVPRGVRVDVAGGVGGGRFIIVRTVEYSDDDLTLTLVENDGTVVGTKVFNPTEPSDDDAGVAALGDGGFVVAWTRTYPDGLSVIYYITYNADFSVRRGETLLGFNEVGYAASVVADGPGGGFSIAYFAKIPDEVRLARVAADGSHVLSTVFASVAEGAETSLSRTADGRYVVGGIGAAGDPVWALVNADGTVLTTSSIGATAGAEFDVEVAGLGAGRLAAFFDTDAVGVGAVVQQLLEVTRTSTGDAGDDVITGDTLRDVMVGGDGDDMLSGLDNDDSLSGGRGRDLLAGGDGNDRLDGGAGDDDLRGGNGNDLYLVDVAGDAVVETAGGGVDTVATALTYALPDHVENLTLTGTGHVTGGGNTLNNRLIGNAGNNRLLGGVGDDVLVGGLGNDDLVGSGGIDTADFSAATVAITVDLNNAGFQDTGLGSDRFTLVENVRGAAMADVLTGDVRNNALFGAGGNDTLTGNGGRDALYGGAGSDVLSGGTEDDLLDGDDGADVLDGGDGTDRLFGDAGNDTLNGGAGIDSLDGGTGKDMLMGGAGRDTLRGGAGIDLLQGGDDADALFGDDEADTLLGEGGDDRLEGGAGVDVLDGGSGRDTLRGGAGADAFVVSTLGHSPVSARDTVLDFEGAGAAAEDVIDLQGVDAIDGGGDDMFSIAAAFTGTAGQLVLKVVGGSTQVLGDTDGDGDADLSILVQGAVGLTAADFLL